MAVNIFSFENLQIFAHIFPIQVELCVKILSDILDLLFQETKNNTFGDISEIMSTILRTVIQTHINMDRESPFAVDYSQINL